MTLGVPGSPPPLLPPVVMLRKCEVTPVNLHKCWAVSSAPCLSFGGPSDLSPLTFRLCCQSSPHKPPSRGCPRMGACPEHQVHRQKPGLRGHSLGWRRHFSWTRGWPRKEDGASTGRAGEVDSRQGVCPGQRPRAPGGRAGPVGPRGWSVRRGLGKRRPGRGPGRCVLSVGGRPPLGLDL